MNYHQNAGIFPLNQLCFQQKSHLKSSLHKNFPKTKPYFDFGIGLSFVLQETHLTLTEHVRVFTTCSLFGCQPLQCEGFWVSLIFH